VNFLEAHKTVAGFQGGERLSFLLAMSGTADPLDVFVRAEAATRARAAEMRVLPFNTLAQALLAGPRPGDLEIFLLLPWDFVPAANWRSGIPRDRPDADDLRRSAQRTADLLVSRRATRLLYVPAPLPPLCSPAEDASLAHWLLSLVWSLNARVLPADVFSLGRYLETGCPFAGAELGRIAEEVIERALAAPTPSRRVLVTDLDNVLWAGVLAEDGIDGIAFAPEGTGYRHFIFQSLLSRLGREGVILCAVSRNDLDVAMEPLRGGRMVLGADDFVAVLGSYQPKSAQIEQLAIQLNLGLDSFVFVDDNPVELAEVASRLPSVHCLAFPAKDEMILSLCGELARLFANPTVTAEDRERTELYRRRLSATLPLDAGETDLTGFLRGLGMKLTIRDRSEGDRSRVVQLINKTNQFNLNGRRVTEEELDRVLAPGGRLYGATLEDRHGSHGEILACLISADGVVTSFVMSCRVFQRRVEHAFLAWLAGQPHPPQQLVFAATPRNTPIQHFLGDPGFRRSGDGAVWFDAERFALAHAGDLSLFTLSAPVARPTALLQ
jgi:FkbH-like protein